MAVACSMAQQRSARRWLGRCGSAKGQRQQRQRPGRLKGAATSNSANTMKEGSCCAHPHRGIGCIAAVFADTRAVGQQATSTTQQPTVEWQLGRCGSPLVVPFGAAASFSSQLPALGPSPCCCCWATGTCSASSHSSSDSPSETIAICGGSSRQEEQWEEQQPAIRAAIDRQPAELPDTWQRCHLARLSLLSPCQSCPAPRPVPQQHSHPNTAQTAQPGLLHSKAPPVPPPPPHSPPCHIPHAWHTTGGSQRSSAAHSTGCRRRAAGHTACR